MIIIGGGPAGVASGVYAGRKQLNTLLITEYFGGQSLNSNDIQNWIGTLTISGAELAQQLESHVREQETVEVVSYVRVERIQKVTDSSYKKPLWDVTAGGKVYRTKAIIIALGGRRRKLGVPGEDTLDGRGVAYCSTCDAPLFRGKAVVVVGSGNAAMEGVIDLLAYARHIYLLIRGDRMKGDEATKEIIEKEQDKVTVIYHAEVTEIHGSTRVEKVSYLDKQTGDIKEIDAQGIFIEIGSIPNSDLVADIVKRNEQGQVVIDHRTGETSQEGIFAAGAVVDQVYDQNNISVGDAIKATLTAHTYLTHFT